MYYVKIVYEFIKSNWQSIVAIISIAVSIISIIKMVITLFKKDRTLGLIAILNKIPTWITQIESLFPLGNGVIKLDYVLKQIKRECENLHVVYNEQYFKDVVEKTLATPTLNRQNQKGGEDNA